MEGGEKSPMGADLKRTTHPAPIMGNGFCWLLGNRAWNHRAIAQLAALSSSYGPRASGSLLIMSEPEARGPEEREAPTGRAPGKSFWAMARPNRPRFLRQQTKPLPKIGA